ncbi:8-hydroxyquercetin 8-O-methyltransferase [Capsicum annuum]|uniref:Myricetin 7/4'-O-methyltransferase 2 n=1 Tax=Capsicum annuum TaxID=4072 RepID=A0A2G2YD92_CAPAN|nr:8-hydroxyquercetin 8-O-methyltransferase [Capsicum annuum]
MSLKCAIQLGIPDIIHNHGQPMTLSDLVKSLPISNINGKTRNCIYRLMRILFHAGFFVQTNLINKEEEKAEKKEEEKEEEGYLLTPTSRLFLKNEPLSLVPFLQVQLDPMMMDPWQCLGKWFKNGDHSSSTTPFGAVHGKSFFEYSVDEPRFNRLFNESMSCDAAWVTSVITEYCKGAFEGLKSLVDIGGGTGTLAKAIVDTFPQISCTVFDLPQVIEGCEGSKNITYVSGDMFKFNPSVDVIFLKGILHDWSDEDCIKILKKCEKAIPIKENGARVIIIDMVLMGQKGDHNAYETKLFMDVLIMVHPFGKERSQQEWAKLFSDSGFSVWLSSGLGRVNPESARVI